MVNNERNSDEFEIGVGKLLILMGEYKNLKYVRWSLNDVYAVELIEGLAVKAKM